MEFLIKLLNRYLHVAIPAVMAFTAVSCIQDFNPDIELSHRLCVNSIIVSGESVDVSLSRTFRYDEGSPEDLDLGVDDATVTLLVDDLVVETLTADRGERDSSQTVFHFSHVAAPGEKIGIRASSPGLGDGNADVVVPLPLADLEATDNFTVRRVLGSPGENYTLLLDGGIRLMLTDNADTADYFRLELEVMDPDPVFTGNVIETITGPWEERYMTTMNFWLVDDSSSALFQEHLGVLDVMIGASSYGMTVFSDRMFSGKSYPVDVNLRDASVIMFNPERIESLFELKLRAIVSTLSESYYNWWLCDWQMAESFLGSLSDIGLAQKINGYSNVSSRAGIVAASTPTVVEVSMAELIRYYYDNPPSAGGY